ncbi:MAG: hypothetical protein JW966_07520 [Anaerolineae bacterium]|nr:hypothetical protein [Anaerolineae bacterium]
MPEQNFTPDSTTTQPVITRRVIAILLVVAGLALVLRLIPQPRTIDDAFITFRYSRNLVEGHGFVYNQGTRTLGTTTPLYTVLMAGIGFVTGGEQYPWYALIVNALADAITAAVLVLMGVRLTGRIGAGVVVGVLWALSPMSVTFAVGGMETSVMILWMVLASYAYVNGREGWAAAFATLGVLTRVDSLIWVGLLFLYMPIMRWRSIPDAAGHARRITRWLPWRSGLIFAGGLLPWYVFSWAYFGTLLSRSLSAKQAAYRVDSFQAMTRLIQHVATPFFEQETLGVPGVVVGLLLYPGLAMIGIRYAATRQPRLLPFLIYPWLYVVAFSIMNPLIFRWYLAPLLPAYFLAIITGVWILADSAGTALQRLRLAPLVMALAGALFAALSLNAWVLHPDHGPDRPAPKMAWHQIELYYKQMADMLRSTYGVTEDTLVSAGDIGAVGYYSRARILDTVGLVTPEMSDYYPVDASLYMDDSANYAVPPDIIFDYQPDYIVFMEMFVRNGLARDPAFYENYAEIAFIPTDFYGTGMLAYQRRD